ncbi:MAG: efflux RND transporter periplasmic adaptor subunit [Gemmatimonadaceae bacterium]|nr:efflux RND transporter periplasmic adaptor subunit [Gemmatimonadaceae bacterium]
MSSLRTAALLASIVAVAACGGGDAPATAQAPATVNIGPDNVMVLAVSTMSSGPAFSGSLVAERTAQIRAEVAGSVLTVLREPGDRVAAGTPLARIDDRAIADAFLSAKAGVTQAQLGADIAKRDYERAQRLFAAGAIAERDVDTARRGTLSADAQLEDAKARLAQAQRQKDATIVTAPYAGVVAERMVNAGDIVAPGAPLFTVVDPSTMRLEGAVPSAQLGQVKLGAGVRFSVTGYPEKTFAGSIAHIAPSADAQTRQVHIIARIPNPGSQLVAGLFAQGRIASLAKDGLAAPITAIDQRGLRPTVSRLKNGKVEHVEVTLGLKDDATERVELRSGVAAGDTLLLGAALGITPGTPLKVSAPSDSPARKP